jgi:hypothetical protein
LNRLPGIVYVDTFGNEYFTVISQVTQAATLFRFWSFLRTINSNPVAQAYNMVRMPDFALDGSFIVKLQTTILHPDDIIFQGFTVHRQLTF